MVRERWKKGMPRGQEECDCTNRFERSGWSERPVQLVMGERLNEELLELWPGERLAAA